MGLDSAPGLWPGLSLRAMRACRALQLPADSRGARPPARELLLAPAARLSRSASFRGQSDDR